MTQDRGQAVWLLIATFIVAVAGLIYELIAATASSYLLGDSVRQFSLVIGIFLSAMGLGAWLSRFVQNPVRGFVYTQLALGIVGGFSAPVIFATFAGYGVVALPLYGSLITIGALSGMEIPLITRVLEQIGATRFRFENVLTFDYMGALVASLAFPLLIIPYLGLMSASLAFGCMNLLVAGGSIWLFREAMGKPIVLLWGIALAACTVTLVQSERLVSAFDAALYADDVVLSERTPYQSITVTRFRDRVRLFLDQSLQFDSRDEYRYHEALVHPAIAAATDPKHVLILGGGDGMAAREVLKHERIETVTLVDLDPRVTELFRDNTQLAELNGFALSDPRLNVVNQDAWQFMSSTERFFDVIIADLPDPKNISISKLYSREFYRMTVQNLSVGGSLVTQAGSPLYANQAYWSIAKTLNNLPVPNRETAVFHTVPYHVLVPSFGDWGFVLISSSATALSNPKFPADLRFLDQNTWRTAQHFSPDISRSETELNSIQSHVLPRYYQAGWAEWFE